MKPLALVILDGFGSSEHTRGNAVRAARMPVWNGLLHSCPHTLLKASGLAVGLPEGQMGNSEVGHLNIGAGRVVYQDLTRIDRAVADGALAANAVLARAMGDIPPGGALHLLGLLSDGGVHSHNTHLYALLDLAAARGVENIYVHAILDGRDVLPQSALLFLRELEARLGAPGRGRLATLCGRYYAMDRDKRWERVSKAYQLYTAGAGRRAADAERAIADSYAAGVTDEFLAPVLLTGEEGDGLMRDGDSVICFNFRADRMREIVAALTQPDCPGLTRPLRPRLRLTCLTEYDPLYNLPTAFPPEDLPDTFGQVLARAGLAQLRLAETEKYAHVTFFFNGGREEAEAGEDRILIPSPQVATYDLQPEMSAPAVTDAALAALERDVYAALIINFANPDMVGHTGVMSAAVRAVEAVDACLGRLCPAVLVRGGTVLITADHGNAEQMIDPASGTPFTAHTTNPVPFVLAGEAGRGLALRPDGALADIAPTALALMGLPQPAAMTGQSLIVKTKGSVANVNN
ncbi:MAG: 2,3-bisphosphoglycerate-independent phosphoglycerate mutase [Gracilibacteraceae bacterium]|jgi:2,3-bisphosphoglycerate-independent phosphoglycerate mutase|nr:2,3-bisphosphoglycerate-independent phosphoglycerate mutase [Gracilibacteraceae bacterium]